MTRPAVGSSRPRPKRCIVIDRQGVSKRYNFSLEPFISWLDIPLVQYVHESKETRQRFCVHRCHFYRIFVKQNGTLLVFCCVLYHATLIQPNRQCPVYGVLLKIRKLQRTRIPSKQLTARRLPVAFPVFIRYWRASLHISCQRFIRSIPLLSIPHVSNRFYLLSSGERTPGAEGCAASRKTRCGKSQNIFVRPC